MILPNKQFYWFILGQAPQVSLAELFSIYPDTGDGFEYAKESGAVKLTVDRDNVNLRKISGTIKVGKEISNLVDKDELSQILVGEFATAGRAEYGVSVYGSETAEEKTSLAMDLDFELKKLLVANGTRARFVDNRGEPVLSSASVVYNKLLTSGKEFLIMAKAGGYAVAVTTAVQPFEEFSARDFGRPGRDDKSGMLPPKLALMMLNIATGHSSFDILNSSFSLLDPFCGSGTVLTEAMLQGYTNLVGSDLSERAIENTKKNIEWTNSRLLPTPYSLLPKLFQADARELSTKLEPRSINTIVTEPYLGPPLRGGDKSNVINKIIDELRPLYKAALQEFVKVLAPGGTVVMIIPRWYCNGEWLTLSNLLPIKNKRFELQPVQLVPKEISKDPFVLYHRPGQFVGREIWKLQLINNNA